jgi:hypothetical protein
VVAVSLLVPFAVIELGDRVAFEDGSTTEAEIESYGQTADGELCAAIIIGGLRVPASAPESRRATDRSGETLHHPA